MGQKEDLINIEELKKIREAAVKIGKKIDLISKKKQSLILELSKIQHACEHKIVVRYNDGQFGSVVCCLNCNKTFYGVIVGVDFCFKNIIDLQTLNTNKNKVKLALKMFEQERIKHPRLSDTEIVKLINKKVLSTQSICKTQGFVKSMCIK